MYFARISRLRPPLRIVPLAVTGPTTTMPHEQHHLRTQVTYMPLSRNSLGQLDIVAVRRKTRTDSERTTGTNIVKVGLQFMLAVKVCVISETNASRQRTILDFDQ